MEFLLGNIPLVASLSFSICGLILLCLAFYYFLRARASLNWPSVPGIIVSSGVGQVMRAMDSLETDFKPEIQYSYRVGNETFISTRIRILPNVVAASSAMASRLIKIYPKDAPVTVYYNPQRPSEAVLEPGVKGDLVSFLVIGAAIFIISLITADYWGLKPLLDSWR